MRINISLDYNQMNKLLFSLLFVALTSSCLIGGCYSACLGGVGIGSQVCYKPAPQICQTYSPPRPAQSCPQTQPRPQAEPQPRPQAKPQARPQVQHQNCASY